MKTIWKYPIEIHDLICIEMPKEAEILTVQSQKGIICIWALVNTDNPTEQRRFRIYGTGNPVEFNGDYIGTFQIYNGDLIFHLFESK